MATLDGVNENRVEHRLMIALMVMTVVTGFIDAVSYRLLAATVAYSTVSTPTNTETPAREPVSLPTEGTRS